MMSMSRVRDDTPQPTMSVTDGAATFSMFCGSGGRSRVRGRQTCGDTGEPARPAAPGAPTSSSPRPHSRSAPSSPQPRAFPGVSPLLPRTGSLSAPPTGITVWPQCPPTSGKGPPPPSPASSPRQQVYTRLGQLFLTPQLCSNGRWQGPGSVGRGVPSTPATDPGPPPRPTPGALQTAAAPRGAPSPPPDSKPGPAAPSAQMPRRASGPSGLGLSHPRGPGQP